MSGRLLFQNQITLEWEEAVIDASEFEKSFGITYQLADIRNPQSTGGTRSTTLKLPGCSENNNIFFHAYTGNLPYRDSEAEVSSQTLKTLRGARVYNDSNLVFDGKAEIRTAFTNKEMPLFYEVNLFAETASWMNELDNVYLSDLPWAEDITWEQSVLIDTWDIDADGGDYASFPVNYGKWKYNNYVSVEDMRPHIFLWHIIHKSFAQIGWRLHSTFLNQAFFKQLVLTYFGNFKMTESYITDNKFYVGRSSDINVSGLAQDIDFNDDSSPYYDNPNAYDTSTGIFTAPVDGYYYFRLKLIMVGTWAGGTVNAVQRFAVKINSSTNLAAGYSDYNITYSPGGTTNTFTLNMPEVKLEAGDIYEIVTSTFGNQAVLDLVLKQDSTLESFLNPAIVENTVFNLADVLDNKIPLSSIIKDIFTLFNLYQKSDVGNKSVIIEPRDDFYLPLVQNQDWTDLVDSTIDKKLDFLTNDYSRGVKFRYASDSNDGYVKHFEEFNGGVTFQSLTFFMQDSFKNGIQEIKPDHIAPTMMMRDDIFDIAGTESPWMPQLWKDFATGNERPDFSTDFLPRILFFEGIRTSYSWRFGTYPNIITDFPIAYAVNPDLNGSGLPQSLAFSNYGEGVNTYNGLFHEFWRNEMYVVRDGYIATMQVRLNAKIMRELELLAESNSTCLWQLPLWIKDRYFVINKIIDYNPFSFDTTQVEFLPYQQIQPAVAQDLIEHFDGNGGQGGGGSDFGENVDSGVFTDKVLVQGSNVPSPYDTDVENGASPFERGYAINDGSSNAVAQGQGGRALGTDTIVTKPYGVAFGKFNDPSPDAYFQIGKGTTNESRSNVFEVIDENGIPVLKVGGFTEWWEKFTVNYSDFTDAATTQTIYLKILKAGDTALQWKFKLNEAFAAIGLTNATMDVLDAGGSSLTSDSCIGAVSNFVGTINSITAITIWDENNDGDHFEIKMTLVGANLNDLTAGSFDLWVKFARLI